jgi:hypothetical protein
MPSEAAPSEAPTLSYAPASSFPPILVAALVFLWLWTAQEATLAAVLILLPLLFMGDALVDSVGNLFFAFLLSFPFLFLGFLFARAAWHTASDAYRIHRRMPWALTVARDSVIDHLHLWLIVGTLLGFMALAVASLSSFGAAAILLIAYALWLLIPITTALLLTRVLTQSRRAGTFQPPKPANLPNRYTPLHAATSLTGRICKEPASYIT